MDTSVGTLLRQWRQARRYSQLQLALELGISGRHLCFLETGRSKPSREMLLKIALFLLVPKAELNQALLAAGYAPMYPNSVDTATNLKPALNAIELMLKQHLPYPAFVINQDWDMVNANLAAQQLWQDLGYTTANFVEAIIEDAQIQQKIINWLEVAEHLLQRIHRELFNNASSARLLKLEKKLASFIEDKTNKNHLLNNSVILSTQLKVDEKNLAFFSIIAQLSSVQDLVMSEYKIELFFPADETTRLFYEKPMQS